MEGPRNGREEGGPVEEVVEMAGGDDDRTRHRQMLAALDPEIEVAPDQYPPRGPQRPPRHVAHQWLND